MFNLGAVNEAIAAAFPDKEAIVFRDRRITFGAARTTARGGSPTTWCRAGSACTGRARRLKPWESGQDQLALYLFNGNEYLEGMLGGYKARVAPFNVNYRYVEEELEYLLNNARARAIIYHASFAPRVAAVRAKVPSLAVFIQVADESGNALLPGAVDYETVLAQSSAGAAGRSIGRRTISTSSIPAVRPVCRRACCGGRPTFWLRRLAAAPPTAASCETLDEYVERAKTVSMKTFPAAPYMHGAGHWIALSGVASGQHRVHSERRRTARSGRHPVVDRTREDQLPADRRRCVCAADRRCDPQRQLRPVESRHHPVGRRAAERVDQGRDSRSVAERHDHRRSRFVGGGWAGLADQQQTNRREHRQIRTGTRQRRRRRSDDEGAAARP